MKLPYKDMKYKFFIFIVQQKTVNYYEKNTCSY